MKLVAPSAAGTRATKLELAGSYDAAFTAYISAAQTYLFLIRHTLDPDTKVKLRAVSGKLVERAERIKAAKKQDLRPVQRSALSLEEQDAVLQKGALVGSRRLRPWTGSDQARIAESSPLHPPLSPVQEAAGCHWLRCADIFPGAPMLGEDMRDIDIVQDNVTDCSVVAALIVAAQHHARHRSNVGLSCLFPQDESGLPRLSRDGLYSARFLVNGTWIQIDIDDLLPVSTEGAPMFASTRHHDQLWPALIEKAYLALMGGYDFKGSNSANDLYVMTGWLPETISLRCGFQSEATWQRIRAGFSLGHCVLTAGTGKAEDGGRSSLAPLHNYAIIDVREEQGVRQVVLVNPWRDVKTSAEVWTAGLRGALDDVEGPQTLLVDWDSLPAHFASLHVNWDPEVLDFSDTVHLSAPATSVTKSSAGPSLKHRHSMRIRLQVESKPSLPSEVWLFLARHTNAPLAKGEYIGVSVARCAGEVNGRPEGLSLDDASSVHDNLYELYRFQPGVGAGTYDLTVSHEGLEPDFCFSLRALSNSRVKFVEGPPPLPYAIPGSWAGPAAGGNHTCHTFLNNPQYSVKIAPLAGSPNQKATLEIVSETDKDSPINVKLLYRNGARATDFEARDVLAGGSTYAYGRQSCSARDVAPGTYTLVVSSFQPRHVADFSLAVTSSLPVEVVPIPPEGAGMYARQVKGAWCEGSDGGKSDLRQNPRFILQMSKPTSVKIRLQTPAEPLPIAVSLFTASSTGQPDRLVASSGAYSDAVCGVVLTSTRLEPAQHGYLVVPSTFQSGMHADFTVLLYADAPVTLSAVE